MTKVLERKLSYGEELDNRRRAERHAGRPTNTYTYSVRIGDLHYELHQTTNPKTKPLQRQ